jgi:hypothetical protein
MAKGKYAPELSVLNARKAFMDSAFQSTNVVSNIPTEEKMLCSSKKIYIPPSTLCICYHI